MLKPIFEESEKRMQKGVDAFKKELNGIRTGVASTALLDNIRVNCYGSKMPLNQVANVNTPEPGCLLIQPWDVSTLGEIEKAILTSDLGLVPTSDGKILRIIIPPLSEERRREMTKLVGKAEEEAKVAIRSVRRDANDSVKKLLKEKTISEDDSRGAEDEIQKETNKYIAQIEKIAENKKSDLMRV